MRSIAFASAAWAVLLVFFVDCSHTTQYVRPGTPKVPVPKRNEPIAPAHRLIVVGDAGHALGTSDVLTLLSQRASLNPEHTTVVFLGDNIYPRGLPPKDAEDRTRAERFLKAQIDSVVHTGARAYFLPGNHDWAHSGSDGRAAVLRQAEFVRQHGQERVRYAPAQAKPGPACIDRDNVRLVLLDTHWWLHEHDKPDIAENKVVANIRQCLASAGSRTAIALAHHPLTTHGPHGGFSSFRDHVFPLTHLVRWLYVPLPIVGSLYPLARSMGSTPQDVSHDRNAHMVRALTSAFSEHPPLAYAAGHEHSLQIHDGPGALPYHLVSGAGSGTTGVTHGKDTIFALERYGFMELNFLASGQVILDVYALVENTALKNVKPVFSLQLK